MGTTLARALLRRSLRIAGSMSGALIAFGAARLGAQGTVVGRVVEARSSLPVAGATIEVAGTRLGALTDAQGRYRIAAVPAGARRLAARRIGFTQVDSSVTVSANGETTVNFALQQAAVSLDQVVVTGTAGAERLREVGNSVATIDVTSTLEKAQVPNLSSLLTARVAGVQINGVTGRLGAGPSISIRGVSSLGQGNSPLIYLDGVRVNNSTGLGAVNGSFAAQGSAVAGRLNDINPNDIESIEIIKGPAASTIYGTEASNGVIQIITRKGSVGAAPRFSMQAQEGTIFFRDAEHRIPTNYLKDSTGKIVAWNGVTAEEDRGTPIYRTGRAVSYTGSIAGGRDQVRYYASGSFDNERGIEPNNFTRQFSLHSNLDVAASPKMDFSASLNFVDGRNHLGTDQGLSATLGAMLGHILLNPKSRGFGLGFPPELPWQLYDNSDYVDRFTTSATGNYRAFDWLNQRLLIGLDYANGDDRTLERFATPDLAGFLTPTSAAGRLGQSLRKTFNITADYSATANVHLRPTLTSSSSVGVQTVRQENNTSGLGGQGFPAPGVETISGAATPLTQSQSYSLNTTVGGYVQERFGWRDRVFLAGAVRIDNNSAFGQDFKWISYPKADLSWVVSDEPFWKFDRFAKTLRVRAAYGESGNAPSAFSALRTFSPVQGPGGTSAVTPGSLGNPNLKPEVAKELEMGFETTLFDRLTLDFTHFSKKTIGEIVNQSVAPSSGFPGSIPLNLGRVDNSGAELLATLHAVSARNLEWEIVGNWSKSTDIIKDLGVASSAVSACGGANRVGLPIGGYWCKRVVSADRNATTNLPQNILCDGGDGKPAIACASAPFVYLGAARPSTTGSVANTVTLFHNVRLYALVDFKGGGLRYLQDRELRCTGTGGGQLCEENWYPERFDPVVLAEVVSTARAQNIVDQYYTNANFAKLREVSINYQLPTRIVPRASQASINLAGRELHTWTSFKATDPENNGQAILPPLSRFTATLNIKF